MSQGSWVPGLKEVKSTSFLNPRWRNRESHSSDATVALFSTVRDRASANALATDSIYTGDREIEARLQVLTISPKMVRSLRDLVYNFDNILTVT